MYSKTILLAFVAAVCAQQHTTAAPAAQPKNQPAQQGQYNTPTGQDQNHGQQPNYQAPAAQPQQPQAANTPAAQPAAASTAVAAPAAVSSPAAAAAAGSSLLINTPTGVTQCQASMLTFGGGQAPYFITVLPGGQPSATPLYSFPQTTQTSLSWTVNVPAGTSISLAIKDATGAINVTVNPGSSSCQLVSAPAGASSATLPATTAVIVNAANATASATASSATAVHGGALALSPKQAFAGLALLAGAVLAH